MQSVAIHWHVYLLTKSAFALGMIGFFKGVPIILCSLAGGVVADAVDRRRLMMATQSVMLVSSAILAVVTLGGLRSVWPIYLLTGLTSAATAFDIPARQALMPMLVPGKDFANAVSLGLIVFNVAMIAGPAMAGLLLASHGPALVYGVNAVSFLTIIFAVLAMRTSGRPDHEGEAKAVVSFSALKHGLRFVWGTPIIVQTMTLDFAATFFASANALLPIFAAEILQVGARGLGILAAAPAFGSVSMALVMARVGSFRKQGRLVIGSITIFGLATVAFGLAGFLGFVVDAGNHRRCRYSEHGRETNHQATRNPESTARPHDVDQHDLLHGRAATGRSGGGTCCCLNRCTSISGYRRSWFNTVGHDSGGQKTIPIELRA